MAHAQDDSFDTRCGVRSADGTVQIMLLDNPTALPPATQQLIATANKDGGTLRLPGLEIGNSPQTITVMVLTTDDWSTLDGLKVGMTKDDVLLLTEEVGMHSPSFSDDGRLSQLNGDPIEDQYRMCLIDVQLGDNDTVASIAITHAPMSINWDPDPVRPPQPVSPPPEK